MGEATGKQVKRSRGNGDRGRSETASAAQGNAPLPPPPPRPIERFSRVFSVKLFCRPEQLPNKLVAGPDWTAEST